MWLKCATYMKLIFNFLKTFLKLLRIGYLKVISVRK